MTDTPSDSPPLTEVEFFFLCDHVFSDSVGNPCIIGLFRRELVAAEFPYFRPLLSFAIMLRSEPRRRITVRVQFGPSLADVMREGLVNAAFSSDGRLFIPFHMPQLRFDHPGEYFATVADVTDDNRIIGTSKMKISQRA